MPPPPSRPRSIGRARTLVDKVQRDLLRAVITAPAPISRTSYAAATPGVSLPTIQRAVNNLLAARLLIQAEDLPLTSPGRPERALRVNPDHVYIGLAIEDRSPTTKTNVGWQVSAIGVTLEGEPYEGAMAAEVEPIHGPHGVDQLVKAARTAVARVRKKIDERGAQVHGLGVSVGGHVQDGILKYSPNLQWKNVPLAQLLTDATGLPTLVDNDVNALARQRLWGKEGGSEMNFTVVLLKPDGIGSGNVVNGQVFTGAHQMSGEIGHLKLYPPGNAPKCRCGSLNGCVEALATVQAIAKGLGLKERDWATAVARADKGETDAEQAFRQGGEFLGRALSHVVNTFDPERIYLLGVPELVDREHRTAAIYLDAVHATLAGDSFPSARIRSDEGLIQVLPEGLPAVEDQAVAAAISHIELLVQNQPSGPEQG